MSAQGSSGDRFPPQIRFIIGNEAAERYSFYGMKAILTLFMTDYLLFDGDKATSVFHLFVTAVYFTPLLGAYLSDRYWGKYRTIMTLSMVYIAGHGGNPGW
jgi:POT family proton-dependent oligopeptide transporter